MHSISSILIQCTLISHHETLNCNSVDGTDCPERMIIFELLYVL